MSDPGSSSAGRPASPEFKCDVPTVDLLYRLPSLTPPAPLRPDPVRREFHRDIYLDTPDLSLWRRGIACRLRLRGDGRRVLGLTIGGPGGLSSVEPRERFEATLAGSELTGSELTGSELTGSELAGSEAADADPTRALRGQTDPARRLRGLIDPSVLKPVLELETERWVRPMRAGLFRLPRFEFAYDRVTVRLGGLSRVFQEMRVRRMRAGPPSLEELARGLGEDPGLRTILESKFQRGQRIHAGLERESASRSLRTGHAVAIIALTDGRIALSEGPDGLCLPIAEGSGEEACRYLMRNRFGTGVAELTLLGTAPGGELRPALEVWLARRVRRDSSGDGVRNLTWVATDEIVAQLGTGAMQDPDTLAALMVAGRSGLLPGWSPAEDAPSQYPPSPSREDGAGAPAVATAAAAEPAEPVVDEESGLFLDGELSLLEFNARVLALAEERAVPLLDRVRYLAIVAANLDEFFMVSLGGLKRRLGQVAPESSGARAIRERLDLIGLRTRALVEREYAAFDLLRAELARLGIHLRRWEDVGPEGREELRRQFKDQIFPILIPRAITQSPGFPLPVIPHLTLCLAVTVADPRTGPLHFAYLRVPDRLPRFLHLEEGLGEGYIPIEDVIRAHLDALYPTRSVEEAFTFRVTRGGDLQVEEDTAGDLLQAIEEEVARRPQAPPVRVEVESGMGRLVRELLLRELRYEPRGAVAPLGEADLYQADGPVGLGSLRELADLPLPGHRYPPFRGRSPLPDDRPLWDTLREREVLVHHPYEDFGATVQRFFAEAAADPDVEAIRLTLYRAGDQSPIVDALVEAAEAGKEVAVFIELKARFDEARNIGVVRRLEQAGASVVYGLVGLKNHAKVALVVRREAGATRRYVHVGTGNYNPATARFYTDLGLLSSDEALGLDLNDLFNELTGSSRPPRASYRRLVVGPTYLLPFFLERIEREIGHAKAGRPARIRLKLNGLADADVVRALYRASQAGVDVEAVVRGICTLRPGVAGLSERIRVVSLLGRFLEHARIYHFANGGEAEYLIGSADWRPRNLRRRIEVAVPVRDAGASGRLDDILTRELADPTAWTLDPGGSYGREAPAAELSRQSAQERFLAGAGM